MGKIAFLVLTSFISSLISLESVAATCPALIKGSDSMTTWRPSPYRPARAVAMVVHGLNLKPSRMSAIEDTLRNDGIDVLRVRLAGHNNNINIFKMVTAEMWERDILRSYCIADERADRYQLPLYYVGYSLGGVMGVAAPSKFSHVRFDKMVLFAPALSIRRTPFILRILNTLNPLTIIPNLFNRNNGAASAIGVPVTAYLATFKIADFVSKQTRRNAINVPTLVFYDLRDELISPSGIRGFVSGYRLDKWKLYEVHKRPFSWQSMFHHMMIDPGAVGRARWQQMTAAMLELLDHDSKPNHMLSSTPESEESSYVLSDQTDQM